VDPTVKQLRYLVAVADQLHFRRAAEACHVTQPALSEQIAQLEDLLGVRLVERSRRRVMMTPVGEEVVRRARRVLRDLDDLVQTAGRAGQPFSTPLRMGVIPTIAPYLLPRILAQVRAESPELQLLLREEQTGRVVADLREGRLDVGLLALPIEGDDLEVQELYQEDFVLLSPRGRGRQSTRRLPVTELAQRRVLLLEEGHCLRQQALEVCAMAGARENDDFRASSLGTLVQMVANGIGVTLLPWLALDVEVRGQSALAVRRFKPPVPSRRVGLIWRRHSARRDEIRDLGRMIHRHLPAADRNGFRPAPAA